MTPASVTLPDCLTPTTARLIVELVEGAASVSVHAPEERATCRVEFTELEAALRLLQAHDAARADRIRAERDAEPQLRRDAERETDKAMLRDANNRIHELIDLLEQAETELRTLKPPPQPDACRELPASTDTAPPRAGDAADEEDAAAGSAGDPADNPTPGNAEDAANRAEAEE